MDRASHIKKCIDRTHMHGQSAQTYILRKKEAKSILLFCNPESCRERNNMTLKVSFDDGQTWPSAHKVLLDEWGGFGYSCITSVDDETIGILYESSQAQLVFQQIKLKELLTNK